MDFNVKKVLIIENEQQKTANNVEKLKKCYSVTELKENNDAKLFELIVIEKPDIIVFDAASDCCNDDFISKIKNSLAVSQKRIPVMAIGFDDAVRVCKKADIYLSAPDSDGFLTSVEMLAKLSDIFNGERDQRTDRTIIDNKFFSRIAVKLVEKFSRKIMQRSNAESPCGTLNFHE